MFSAAKGEFTGHDTNFFLTRRMKVNCTAVGSNLGKSTIDILYSALYPIVRIDETRVVKYAPEIPITDPSRHRLPTQREALTKTCGSWSGE
jgi:UDP-3-O-acyl-N-acetylglucosamine deacetylase